MKSKKLKSLEQRASSFQSLLSRVLMKCFRTMLGSLFVSDVSIPSKQGTDEIRGTLTGRGRPMAVSIPSKQGTDEIIVIATSSLPTTPPGFNPF